MQNAILIYGGPGVSKESLRQTLLGLEYFLAPAYKIQIATPKFLIHHDWESTTKMLVMPGGADIPYTTALNGKGNAKIRAYVEQGGSFLGICAGSYYAGKYIDFAKDTSIAVQGTRELAFFNGTVCGPLLADYDYRVPSGVRTGTVVWQDEQSFGKDSEFQVFYHGGGYFVEAAADASTKVLATYSTGIHHPAIIECQVGRGKAILSGVHFEYDPLSMDKTNAYVQQIIPALEAGNENRLKLFKHLIERLHIHQT